MEMDIPMLMFPMPAVIRLLIVLSAIHSRAGHQ